MQHSAAARERVISFICFTIQEHAFVKTLRPHYAILQNAPPQNFNVQVSQELTTWINNHATTLNQVMHIISSAVQRLRS